MVQMRVGEQHVVDGGGIKAERSGVLLVQLAATLMQPAIDEDALARAFDQMTGAGDAAIGAVKGQLQVTLPGMRRSLKETTVAALALLVRQSANRSGFAALAVYGGDLST